MSNPFLQETNNTGYLDSAKPPDSIAADTHAIRLNESMYAAFYNIHPKFQVVPVASAGLAGSITFNADLESCTEINVSDRTAEQEDMLWPDYAIGDLLRVVSKEGKNFWYEITGAPVAITGGFTLPVTVQASSLTYSPTLSEFIMMMPYKFGGAGAAETLSQTLAAGNVTGGESIEVENQDIILFSDTGTMIVSDTINVDGFSIINDDIALFTQRFLRFEGGGSDFVILESANTAIGSRSFVTLSPNTDAVIGTQIGPISNTLSMDLAGNANLSTYLNTRDDGVGYTGLYTDDAAGQIKRGVISPRDAMPMIHSIPQAQNINTAANVNFQAPSRTDTGWTQAAGTNSFVFTGDPDRVEISMMIASGIGAVNAQRVSPIISLLRNGVLVAEARTGYIRDSIGHEETSHTIHWTDPAPGTNPDYTVTSSAGTTMNDVVTIQLGHFTATAIL